MGRAGAEDWVLVVAPAIYAGVIGRGDAMACSKPAIKKNPLAFGAGAVGRDELVGGPPHDGCHVWPDPDAPPDRFLAVRGEVVTLDLDTVPFESLETLVLISDQRPGPRGQPLLLVTPNLVKLGRTADPSAGADRSSGRPSLAWAAIGNTTRALITIATSHTRAPLKCTPLPRRNRAIVVAAFAESSGLRAKDAAEHKRCRWPRRSSRGQRTSMIQNTPWSSSHTVPSMTGRRFNR